MSCVVFPIFLPHSVLAQETTRTGDPPSLPPLRCLTGNQLHSALTTTTTDGEVQKGRDGAERKCRSSGLELHAAQHAARSRVGLLHFSGAHGRLRRLESVQFLFPGASNGHVPVPVPSPLCLSSDVSPLSRE